jgi:hypothetical protein
LALSDRGPASRLAAQDLRSMSSRLPWATLLLATLPSLVGAQPRPCGLSPNDWCPSPDGDRCGRHRTVADCRADPVCYGMPYRGESMVACILDKRGFASNCPTVGCISAPPQPVAR